MPGRGGRNRGEDAHHYWTNVASTKPEAQELASRLGLDFPKPPQGFQGGLKYPIRRLIITGEDTAGNFTTLLGPLWEFSAEEIVKQTRIDVLLCPPIGSPNRAFSEHLDAGSPYWNPRPPNAEEEAEISKVKGMKSQVENQLDGRKSFGKANLKQLIASLGDNWLEQLPALESAVNNTDQSVGK